MLQMAARPTVFPVTKRPASRVRLMASADVPIRVRGANLLGLFAAGDALLIPFSEDAKSTFLDEAHGPFTVCHTAVLTFSAAPVVKV